MFIVVCFPEAGPGQERSLAAQVPAWLQRRGSSCGGAVLLPPCGRELGAAVQPAALGGAGRSERRQGWVCLGVLEEGVGCSLLGSGLCVLGALCLQLT